MHHSIDVTLSNQWIESFSSLTLAQNEGYRTAVEDTYKVSNLRNGGNDACITFLDKWKFRVRLRAGIWLRLSVLSLSTISSM